MGKIFGISNLPVSTIGKTIEPVQNLLVKEQYVRRISTPKLLKKPYTGDIFQKTINKPNTKRKVLNSSKKELNINSQE